MKKLFSVNHNTKNVDFALLITRVSIALLMLTHGLPKMSGFAESPVKFMDILGLGTTVSLGLAVFAEVLCSVFVLLGFFIMGSGRYSLDSLLLKKENSFLSKKMVTANR